MKGLSAGQVTRLHAAALDRFWGDPGLRDPGLLESALARPFAQFAGTEAHPGVHEKAAALLHGLVINHPFVDGNKPVALAATLVFLRLNGFRVSADQDELYDLVMQIAKGRMSTAELARRLHRSIERDP